MYKYDKCVYIQVCILIHVFIFQLKAVQLSSKLEVNASAEVKFDSDLPEFRTNGGANFGSRNHE